jgi:hypothetical protein
MWCAVLVGEKLVGVTVRRRRCLQDEIVAD